MNPEGGYTRQYRRMWDNPVFRNYQEAAVFSWMKDMARWKPCRISTKFGPVDLGRGELLIAERTLAEKFGLHRNTLRALLQRLIDDSTIAVFRDRCPQNAGTIVRVINYEEYQGLEDGFEQPQDRSETADGTASGPLKDRSRTKIKEGNQGKESEGGEETARAKPAVTPNQIIRAFDDARAEAFGQHLRRPFPNQIDSVIAQRWLQVGADLALCAAVFEAGCRSRHASNPADPPRSLKFFDQQIANALAERDRPMPEGHADEQRHRHPHRAAGADIDEAVLRGVFNAMAPELEGDGSGS